MNVYLFSVYPIQTVPFSPEMIHPVRRAEFTRKHVYGNEIKYITQGYKLNDLEYINMKNFHSFVLILILISRTDFTRQACAV